MTLWRVFSRTAERLFKTRSTVAGPTPATEAIWRIVGPFQAVLTLALVNVGLPS